MDREVYKSVVNQNNIKKHTIEILIVNDSSKDNTSKVLKLLKDFSNIKVINNKVNLGLSRSLNKALKISLGRYVVRLDSDDYIARDYLYLSNAFFRYE